MSASAAATDQQIIKDIGTLYFWLFDKTAFADNETKFFLQEFETKRGDPTQKIKQANSLMKEANAAVVDCQAIIDANVETIQAHVTSCTRKLKEQLSKESVCQRERDMVRESRMPREQQELQTFIAAETAKRKQIEVETEQKIKSIHEKYSSLGMTQPTSS